MLKPTAQTILGTRGGRPMKMGLRRQLPLALLVLLALAVPMQAKAAGQVPFKASETGTSRLLGPCETGGVVLDVTGTGYATQLGTYSSHYRECFDPATGAVTNGSFTLTAANLDTVFGTYSGQVSPTDDPNVIAYYDPGVITGGTGRFARASGSVTQSGVANLATGEYAGTIAGSVSSPASP